MNNKSYRIRTEPYSGDQQIKIKLDQHYDQLDVLSLTLKPVDTWANRCADFGVVVGRVSANKGFGVPNAKVSIFIPLTSEDESNPEIVARYPYKQISDKRDSIRYNLLPSIKQHPTHTPVGNFPTKEEILRDDLWLEIYQKYYKFTTRTNDAGDFMFYGVPIGTYIIHYDIDISDIDDLSVVPFELIAQGKPEQMFDGPYKFKGSTDIDSLAQIITLDKTISVQPFWGSTDLCDVQITRSDFDLSDKGVELKSYALFIGSAVTDSDKNLVNQRCKVKKQVGEQQQLEAMPGKIEILTVVDSDGDNVPDSVEFLEMPTAKIDDNGAWAFLVELNGQRVMKDEFGNEIISPNASQGVVKNGFFRFKFSLGVDSNDNVKYRAKYIVPNNGVHEYAYLFNRLDVDYSDTSGNVLGTIPGFNSLGDDGYTIGSDGYYHSGPLFREFTRKKIYTVRNYIPRYLKQEGIMDIWETSKFLGFKNVDVNKSKAPIPYNRMDTKPGVMYDLMCILYSVVFFLAATMNNILSVLNTIIQAINDFIAVLINALCWVIDLINELTVCFNFGEYTIGDIITINLNFGCITFWSFSLPSFCSNIPHFDYVPYISFSCCSQCDDSWRNCYIPFYDCYNTDSICDETGVGLKQLKRCPGSHYSDCAEYCHQQVTNGMSLDPQQAACKINPNACNNFNLSIGEQGWTDNLYSFCLDSLKQCMMGQYVCNHNELKLEFYNAWITGLLYFTQIRYKEKTNNNGYLKKAKFCDADWYETGQHHQTHPFKNDYYSMKVTDRTIFKHNGYSDLSVDAGLIKYWPRLPQPILGDASTSDYLKGPFDDIYYNARQMKRSLGYDTTPPPTDINSGNILLATEIMVLGSYLVTEDPEGAPFFISQVPATTYKLSEDLSNFFCFSCTKIVPNDVTLHEKISEFGTDLNDEGETTYQTNIQYGISIDESFLSGRTYILYSNTVNNLINQSVPLRYGHTILNNNQNTNYIFIGQEKTDPSLQSEADNVYINQYGSANYVPIFFNYQSNNTTLPVQTNDIRDLYIRYEANPYYMYYGLHPGKTAIDLVHNNFIPKNICNL